MCKFYSCKYCSGQYKTNQSRNGHQNHCLLNPKKAEIELKIKQSSKGKASKHISKRWVEKFCKRCGKVYNVYVTKQSEAKNTYTKHCSRKCANSRDRSLQIKEKISNSLKNNYTNLVYTNCTVCNKIIICKAGKRKNTCSYQCLHIALIKAGEKSIKSGGG